jgi:general secretion pathway protein G
MMKFCFSRFRLAVFIFVVCVVSLSGICCSPFRRMEEKNLKDNLAIMRQAIRTYAVKRGELPQTLKDLEAEGVYATVPDSITGRADWQVTIGEDPALVKGKRGIINVHSASTAVSSEGTPYNTW